MIAELTAPLRIQDARPITRAEVLAHRFLRANDEAIAALERYPETRWRAEQRQGSGYSAATEVYELAEDYLDLAGCIAAVASGDPLPSLRNDLSERRVQRGSPRYGKDVAAELLRRRAAAAARIIGTLEDYQLDRATSYFGTRLTVAQLVDELLIAHVQERGQSLHADA